MKVLIFGTFDDLHPGHEFVISEALKRGMTTVIVARDANVRRIKGHAPLQPEEERRAAIERAFPAAQALLGDTNDFLQPVRTLQPDLILLGYDQELPPGVSERDFPCPVERITAFKPETFKSSLRRKAPRSALRAPRGKPRMGG